MSRVAYIRAWPRDPATGAVGLVTMAGGGSHLPYLIGNTHYRAGIVREPRFAASLGFGENGWTGAAMPQISVIEFAPGDPALLRAYQSLYWKDAPIEVDAGEETAGVGRILTGIIGDATVEGDRLMIAVADFGVKLAKPLIQSWFAGTGGIEGDATADGRVKRRSFGAVLNIEGRILNAANNIYEFGDPAYPLQNFTAVRDMGRAGPTYLVDWQGSAAATLAALIATPAQQGGAMIAPSIACVKWWTQPAGPLTADIQGENTGGYVETPVSIAARVLAAVNGPAIVNQAAANAIRNFPVGLHIADDSETAAGALDRLLLPVSLLWRFGTTGQIDVRPWDWNGSAEVVRGRYLGRTKTLAPTKTRRLGYARNHRLHSEGEIAADIIAAGVSYADGSTLEQLKPAEGGANVTGNHSAAAFAGQGALATRNDVIFGSHITSLPAAINPSNLISGDYLSAGFARYLDNVTVQALRPGEAGANITEGRVASAVAGQGAFATLNNLAFGSPLLSGFGALASLSGLAFGSPQLTGFGSLAGLGNLFFGSPYLLEGSGGAQATLSAFKTVLGISSGFTGQGWGATASQSLLDNRQVQVGRNYAVNSRFSRGSYGWRSASALDTVVETTGDWAGVRNTYRARFVGTLGLNVEHDALFQLGTWGGGTLEELRQFGLPVVNGDRVASCIRLGRHRCVSRLYCLIFDKGGQLVQAPNWTGGRDGGAQNGNPANMDRVGDVFDVVASNAAFAILMVRMIGTGEADPYIFATEALLAKVPAGTSVLPDYVDGPTDPLADKTGSNVSAAFAGQGGLATRNSVDLSNGTVTNLYAEYLTYYATSQTVASLRPAEAGSNVTEGRTAAAFAGQGALATRSSIGWTDSLFTGRPSYLVDTVQRPGYPGEQALRADYVTQAGSGVALVSRWPQEAGANVTEGRTAAAFSGQGGLATRNSVDLSNGTVTNLYAEYLTYYATSQTVASLRPAEAGSNVTEGRTAAAFSGQGALATRSSIGWSDSLFTGRPQYLTDTVARPGYPGEQALRADYVTQAGSGVALVNRWPQEAGANVTEGRTAAAFSGQGGLATRNSVDLSNGTVTNLYAEYLTYYATSQTVASLRPAEAGSNVTEGRTAAAFSGQGGLATRNSVDLSNGTVTNLYAEYLTYYATSQTVASLRPAEAGSNVTEGRTAAAFSGQGALATRSSIGWSDSLFTGRPQYLTDTVARPGYPGEQALRADYVTQAGSGVALVSRWPQEAGANVTEGRTAAAFSGQGGLATRNSVDLSNGTVTNLYAEYLTYYATSQTVASLRPAEAGSNVTEGRTAAAFSGQGALATRSSIGWSDSLFTGRPQYLTDTVARPGYPGEQALRADYVTQAGSGVALVNRWPQEAGANVTEARTASGIAGQGSFATQSWINSGNVASFFAYSAFRLEYNITRFDGSTIVTENMVITTQGVSAGFVGQGVGATANNLAQLDPSQNDKLNGLVTGSRRAYGYGQTARIVLNNGGSYYFEGAIRTNSGGNNGQMSARIDISLAGQNSWSTVATGDSATVGPSEPGFSSVLGNFTNTSGSTRAYDVRIEVNRVGSTAGGAVDNTASYLLV